MRVTIVADDERVSVNGFSEYVDCSALQDDISVIQWYGEFGEIEFVTDEEGNRKPNERITDFVPYKAFLDAWEAEAQKNVA